MAYETCCPSVNLSAIFVDRFKRPLVVDVLRLGEYDDVVEMREKRVDSNDVRGRADDFGYVFSISGHPHAEYGIALRWQKWTVTKVKRSGRMRQLQDNSFCVWDGLCRSHRPRQLLSQPRPVQDLLEYQLCCKFGSVWRNLTLVDAIALPFSWDPEPHALPDCVILRVLLTVWVPVIRLVTGGATNVQDAIGFEGLQHSLRSSLHSQLQRTSVFLGDPCLRHGVPAIVTFSVAFSILYVVSQHGSTLCALVPPSSSVCQRAVELFGVFARRQSSRPIFPRVSPAADADLDLLHGSRNAVGTP
ncbi:hypothetical protein NUW54_g10583 [Trametes sanguinea]|uniref:Uncharacterized protein n=1 Tax=Trametes sanguinea TaxID=158606 RepID=A0ACC1NZB6_9APHY|nr:hypothetical protein NUW54_g10583 [Trametes sanguinea]